MLTLFNPFNVWNPLAIMLTLLPGIAMIALSDKLSGPPEIEPKVD